METTSTFGNVQGFIPANITIGENYTLSYYTIIKNKQIIFIIKIDVLV